MQYVELCFTVPEEAADAHLEALVAAGAPGVEERDATTLDRPQSGLDGPHVALIAWVVPEEVDAFLKRARELTAGLPEAEVARRDRQDEEWRDAWKRHFTARKVGRFVIVPSWEQYQAAEGESLLHLDPGRAFGTGGHASTRLCLTALSEERLESHRFLDVGCGSGVLTIACAARFSSASGIGVDVDPDAIDVSRENATRNGVEARIRFSTTPVSEIDGRYDLITANIQPDILIPIAGALASLLKRGGRMILSGILTEAAGPVDDAYRRAGLRAVTTDEDEGWRALVYTQERGVP